MTIRTLYIVVFILFVIVSSIFLFEITNSKNDVVSVQSIVPSQPLKPKPSPDIVIPVLPAPVQQLALPQVKTNKPKGDLQDNNRNPWQRDSATELKAFPYENKNNLHYEYVIFNRTFIHQLEVGNELPLYIPQTDANFTGIVNKKSTNKSGSTSYTGSLIDYDDSYQFIITQGAGTTFASVITPDGKYILEAVGSDAWIYDDREFRQKLDYSVTDVVDIDTTLGK